MSFYEIPTQFLNTEGYEVPLSYRGDRLYGVIPEKGSTRYSNCLEDCWSCADGLSAVNAFGMQLRGLIKLGTNPMAVGGIKMDAAAESGRSPVSKHQIQPECGDNEQADTGWDGRTCLARPNS